jgi:SAM-dependent methyltransferase
MTSTSRTYFENIYRDTGDPWDFETSEYEQRKYAVTMASLPRQRYRSVYEPGCSIGVLTALLAQRSERLLASDIIPSVLDTSRRRLQEARHVTVEEREIPTHWPELQFDLVVLSEIAYYFDQEDLELVLRRVMDSLEPHGHVVGVHWRGETDYPLSGDQVHDMIDTTDGLVRVVRHLEPEFVLDVWEKFR